MKASGFLHKNWPFGDVPNKELESLTVDDRRGIVYCFAPKVHTQLSPLYCIVKNVNSAFKVPCDL